MYGCLHAPLIIKMYIAIRSWLGRGFPALTGNHFAIIPNKLVQAVAQNDDNTSTLLEYYTAVDGPQFTCRIASVCPVITALSVVLVTSSSYESLRHSQQCFLLKPTLSCCCDIQGFPIWMCSSFACGASLKIAARGSARWAELLCAKNTCLKLRSG